MQQRCIVSVAAGLALGGILAACTQDGTGLRGQGKAMNVLYVQSNNPTEGQNGVLAYRRAADGTLTPMLGSPFATGGTGVSNPMQKLGPDDLDQNMIASPDHTRLFVVNGGSNTIAVFDIASDGTLTPVAGSPFASGGSEPASLGLSGNLLYVVNKAQDPAHPTTALPNYTAFRVSASGQLTPLAGTTVTTTAGASPSQALVAPNGKVLFGADFMAPLTPPSQGSLRAFALGADGTMTAAPGTPMSIPGDPMKAAVLGLAVHPTQPILYAGFVLQEKLGVYSYDAASGAMMFRTAAANSGDAICWILLNTSGTNLYTSNTGSNSISWYDASMPAAPVERQHLVLKEPGPLFLNPMGKMMPTSESFQFALDPAGTHLYVVSQHTNPDITVTNGNVLHTLAVRADGYLSEDAAPVHLPVPATTRPQGVVVF